MADISRISGSSHLSPQHTDPTLDKFCSELKAGISPFADDLLELLQHPKKSREPDFLDKTSRHVRELGRALEHAQSYIPKHPSLQGDNYLDAVTILNNIVNKPDDGSLLDAAKAHDPDSPNDSPFKAMMATFTRHPHPVERLHEELLLLKDSL